jgi:hypothetical protein
MVIEIWRRNNLAQRNMASLYRSRIAGIMARNAQSAHGIDHQWRKAKSASEKRNGNIGVSIIISGWLA